MKILYVAKLDPSDNQNVVADLYDQVKSGEFIVTRKAPAHIRFWRDIDKNGPMHCKKCNINWNWNENSPNSAYKDLACPVCNKISKEV